MSMSSVRNLLNQSLSSSKRQSNLKPLSPLSSKSQVFADENSAPVDPNIQPQTPLNSNPKKSPFRLQLVSHSKPIEIYRPGPIEEHFAAPDPPVKVVVRSVARFTLLREGLGFSNA